MAKKQKPVAQFELDGHQRDHLRAFAHRQDEKGLYEYVTALVQVEVGKIKVPPVGVEEKE